MGCTHASNKPQDDYVADPLLELLAKAPPFCGSKQSVCEDKHATNCVKSLEELLAMGYTCCADKSAHVNAINRQAKKAPSLVKCTITTKCAACPMEKKCEQKKPQCPMGKTGGKPPPCLKEKKRCKPSSCPTEKKGGKKQPSPNLMGKIKPKCKTHDLKKCSKPRPACPVSNATKYV